MITQQVQYPSKPSTSKTHVDVDSADPILAQCPKPLSLRFPYEKQLVCSTGLVFIFLRKVMLIRDCELINKKGKVLVEGESLRKFLGLRNVIHGSIDCIK